MRETGGTSETRREFNLFTSGLSRVSRASYTQSMAPDLDRQEYGLNPSSFFVALICTIAFGSSGQISESPTETIRSTVTEVFRILEDENLKDSAKLIPRRHIPAMTTAVALHVICICNYLNFAPCSISADGWPTFPYVVACIADTRLLRYRTSAAILARIPEVHHEPRKIRRSPAVLPNQAALHLSP